MIHTATAWVLHLLKLHNKESRFSVEDVSQDYSLSDQREGRTSSNFISELCNDVIEASVIIDVALFVK
jgi:hypothetical protein